MRERNNEVFAKIITDSDTVNFFERYKVRQELIAIQLHRLRKKRDREDFHNRIGFPSFWQEYEEDILMGMFENNRTRKRELLECLK